MAGHTKNGDPLYIIKGTVGKAKTIGKLNSRNGAAYLPYAGKEHTVTSYDVLVLASDQDVSMPSMVWVAAENGTLPSRAILAGSDMYGNPLYVAKATVQGDLTIGALNPNSDCCYVPWGGLAQCAESYEALVVSAELTQEQTDEPGAANECLVVSAPTTELTEEQVDELGVADGCKTVSGVQIVEYGDSRDLCTANVEDPQECARVAANTDGGLFWTYHEKQCHVKKSDEGKGTVEGWMWGNKECGLLSQDQWDQVKEEVILGPKERKDLEDYLTSPQECIQEESQEEDEGQNEPNLQKTLPIIDMFLNPKRSQELKELLNSSQKREVGHDLDEVTNLTL